jgi:large subunit ribosomal protein L35Ae
MKAKIMSLRRGKRTYTPRHFILQVNGIIKREDAEKLKGKTAVWKSVAGKEIKGKIASAHGSKGLVRVVFEKGLPGQALNMDVEIKD